METIFWFILGIFGAIALLILVLTIIIFVKLKRRTRVRCQIIGRNGGLSIIWVKRSEGKFKYNEKTYILDERAIIKTIFRDHMFFMENIPSPVVYDFKAHKVDITGQELTILLETELATILFQMKVIDRILTFLMIVLGIQIIALLMIVWIKMSPVNLANNPENINLIVNATRQGIMG